MSSGIPAKPATCSYLPLREEPVRDTALVEHLDRPRVQPPCARALEVLALASLDDGDVDARQRELGRQHHSRRAPSDDHHRMPGDRK